MKYHTSTSSDRLPSIGALLTKLSLPFALFSSVLTAVLVLSWVFVLPKLTSVEVEGKIQSSMDLDVYVYNLRSQLTELEDARRKFVTPLQGSLYSEMVAQKVDTPMFSLYKSHIAEVAGNMSAKNSVNLRSMVFNTRTSSLLVSGAIENVGPRSMTILAEYTSLLRELPFVESVVSPSFKRQKNSDGEFYSPFEINLSLR